MKTIELPGLLPVILNTSGRSHWKPNGTSHGAKSNPRLFAATLVRLGGAARGYSGRRLWLYFRRGYAVCFDVYVDRRGVA